MRTTSRLAPLALALTLLAACEESATDNSSGAGAVTGDLGSGGLPGAGGATGTGALPGAGGAAGTGGAIASGGLPGTGGAVGTGGAIGAGGLVGTGGAGTGGMTGAGGTTAAACSGKPGAMRGKQDLTVAGRHIVYYAPASLDANTPAPLVFVFHGWTMSGQAMYDLSRWRDIADREGLVIAYPDGGAPGPWNVGAGVCGVGASVATSGNDDDALIDAIKDTVMADQCVDTDHIFATGFSMGGYFSNEIGCNRADFAAVAPHSGGSHDLGACSNAQMPVLVHHGTADGLITFNCGTEARDRWVRKNGCSAEFDTIQVQGGHCELHKDCPGGGQVKLCQYDGMGHVWAGGHPHGFSDPSRESAAELSWAFFQEYAW